MCDLYVPNPCLQCTELCTRMQNRHNSFNRALSHPQFLEYLARRTPTSSQRRKSGLRLKVTFPELDIYVKLTRMKGLEKRKCTEFCTIYPTQNSFIHPRAMFLSLSYAILHTSSCRYSCHGLSTGNQYDSNGQGLSRVHHELCDGNRSRP